MRFTLFSKFKSTRYLLLINLISFCALCFNSCSTKHKANNVELVFKDSVILPFSFIGNVERMPLKNDFSLLRHNFNDSLLEVYNKKFEKQVSIEYLKVMINDNIGSFYPHTPDSIFLVSHKTQTVYLINERGQLIDKWTLQAEKYFGLEITSSWMHYNNNKLYVRAGYNIAASSPAEVVIHAKPNGVIDSVSNFFPAYPPVYSDGNNYNNLATAWIDRILDDKNQRIIYSFPIDHNLYVYTTNGKFLASYPAGSDYITEFYTTPEDKSQDMQFTMKIYGCAPNYHSLVYDPFKKLYYRIAEHGIPLYNEDGTAPNHRNKVWSIVVLDENLKRLGEVKFPSNTYLTTILPMPEGIYIVNYARKKRIEPEGINNKNIGYADLYEIKIK